MTSKVRGMIARCATRFVAGSIETTSPRASLLGTGRTTQSLPSTNASASTTNRFARIEIVVVTRFRTGSIRVTVSWPVSSTQIEPAPAARLRTSLVPGTAIVAVTFPVVGSKRATRSGCETQIEPKAEIICIDDPVIRRP